MKHSHLMEKNKLLCALCGINEELQFQQSRGDACSRKGGVGVGSDLRCLQFCGCEFMLQGFFSFSFGFLTTRLLLLYSRMHTRQCPCVDAMSFRITLYNTAG